MTTKLFRLYSELELYQSLGHNTYHTYTCEKFCSSLNCYLSSSTYEKEHEQLVNIFNNFNHKKIDFNVVCTDELAKYSDRYHNSESFALIIDFSCEKASNLYSECNLFNRDGYIVLIGTTDKLYQYAVSKLPRTYYKLSHFIKADRRSCVKIKKFEYILYRNSDKVGLLGLLVAMNFPNLNFLFLKRRCSLNSELVVKYLYESCMLLNN